MYINEIHLNLYATYILYDFNMVWLVIQITFTKFPHEINMFFFLGCIPSLSINGGGVGDSDEIFDTGGTTRRIS